MGQIKFNSHHYNLFNFAQLSMLVTRLLSKLMPLSAPLRPAYTFAIAVPTPSHPLQAKIFAARTFEDFCKVYQQNKQEMNGDLLAITSKHIISLVSPREYRISFDAANALLAGLSALDLASLSEKTTIGLLSILRSLRIKGFVSGPLMNFKGKLVEHYGKVIREKRVEELDIVDLVGAYNEMAFFKAGQEGRLVANKIVAILKEGVAQGRVAFGTSQTYFLLHCLAQRGDLSPSEAEIRGLMLRRVVEGLSAIKLRDLVRVAVSLNRMEFLDLSAEEYSHVKLITQRILESVQDLEEDSIQEFVRGDFNSKFGGFFRIYEEINANVFASISKKGKSDVDADALFLMLTNIAKKIPLDRNTEENQDKFFAFLENFVQACGENPNMARGLAFKLYGLLSNGFFNQEHRVSIIEMFAATNFPLTTNIVYELALRGSDITPLTSYVGNFDIEGIKEEILLKLGVIVHHLAEKGAQVEHIKATIDERVGGIIATPQQFIEFQRRLSRSSVTIYHFHQAFAKVFERLPNPFAATEQQLPPNYRSYYLTYLLQSLRYRDFISFVQAHEAAVTMEDFASLVSHSMHAEQQGAVELSRGLLQLVARRMQSVVEGKHKRSLDAIIDLLSKYSRFAIGGSLDSFSEATLFRTLHQLISHYDLVVELKSDVPFFNMIERYLNRNYRRYNLETQYRSLVKHLLGRLENIATARPRIAGQLVSTALRFNFLKEQTLTKVNIEELKSLNFFDRCRLSYLKDRNFKPELDRISLSTLNLVFSNHNLEPLLVENEKKVVELIQTAKPKELCGYLSQFTGKTPIYRRILSEILNQLLAQVKGFDKLDMTTLLSNALDGNFYTYIQFRKLTEKLIEEYRNRMSSYSIESHLELIKFIISQPAMNPLEYYNELVSYAQKGDDQHYEAVLIRLASTNYFFKDEELQWLDKIMRKNLFSSIYFFLMSESRFDAATRSRFVKEFSEKYAEWSEKNTSTFNSTHYQYLKKVYPEESASLNLSKEKIHHEKLSVKPKDIEYLNTIIRLAGGVSEELQELGPDNYLLKVKNCVIAFLFTKRIGSYHEHEFTKKAISAIRGEELTTVLINLGSSHSSSLEYIHKIVPSLFDEQEFQKTVTQLKEQEKKVKEAREEKKQA